jgi:hypothetical protein
VWCLAERGRLSSKISLIILAGSAYFIAALLLSRVAQSICLEGQLIHRRLILIRKVWQNLPAKRLFLISFLFSEANAG